MIIGTGSIIPHVEPNHWATQSVDIDLYPLKDSIGFDKDGVFAKKLGEHSAFEEKYGFYVQRVGN